MRFVFALLFAAFVFISFAPAYACTYPSDRASDGSRCGDRASTVRPGGK